MRLEGKNTRDLTAPSNLKTSLTTPVASTCLHVITKPELHIHDTDIILATLALRARRVGVAGSASRDMSIPLPPVEIEGHCSTTHDNTLYVLSPGGFQSLQLKEHAKWSKEKSGVSVQNPACVKVTPNGDESQAALWVIGGTTDDHSYDGLQVYSFAKKSWQTLSTPVPVMKGRTDHSAAYIQDAQSILVYAGSQPQAPSFLSSQTFLIPMQPPYSIQSFISEAPPLHLPILEPFNTSHALLAGGSDLNYALFTFSPWDGWQQLFNYLPSSLDPSARGSIVDGSDGSKVLEVYDMTVSPNQVSQIVLLGAEGVPAFPGQTISASSKGKRKRDVTLDNWPEYNSKHAPTATRADYSVATNSNGVAVIAGGNSDAPIAMFNQDDNSWVDVDKFFNVKNQQPLKPTSSHNVSPATASPSSSSSSPSPTSPASATSSDEERHERMLRTLGITLGVLCGIAAIFILVLLFLRYRKLKQRKREGWLDEKTNEDEGRMSFADRGVSYSKEADGTVNELQPPNKAWNNNAQNGSHSSLAIMTGKYGNRRVSNNNHQPKGSYESTAQLVRDKNGNAMGEPVEMVDIEKPPVERRMTPRTEPTPPAAQYGPTLTESDAEKDERERKKRSSGWSKYFATSAPTGPNGLSHLPSAYAKTNTQSDGSAYSTDRASQPSHIPSSVAVPPLDIDFGRTVDGQRLSHVAKGSPSFNDSREDLAKTGSFAPEGQRGLIVDPKRRGSQSESISSYNRSTMSSTMTGEFFNESATPWTPTSTSFKDHLNSRPPSSVYHPHESRVPSRGKSAGFFPGAGTSHRPQKSPKNKTGFSAAEIRPPPKVQPAEDRDSTMTVFPRGVPSAYYADRERGPPAKPANSDLGWLNLGLNNSQTRL